LYTKLEPQKPKGKKMHITDSICKQISTCLLYVKDQFISTLQRAVVTVCVSLPLTFNTSTICKQGAYMGFTWFLIQTTIIFIITRRLTFITKTWLVCVELGTEMLNII
jgi:hypothetical protein